jgi:hypothetical protein
MGRDTSHEDVGKKNATEWCAERGTGSVVAERCGWGRHNLSKQGLRCGGEQPLLHSWHAKTVHFSITMIPL